MDNSGPAFPYDVIATDSCGVERVQAIYPGMSLRDYFAAKAMQGQLAALSGQHLSRSLQEESGGRPAEYLSVSSYELADAMLVQREKSV